MIWQCLECTIHMYVAKMRYPEIHKNKLNQFNIHYLTYIEQIQYNTTINQYMEAMIGGTFE